MADVKYVHICDYAFTAQGGKPCIIGVFSEVSAPFFPYTHPSMAIALQIQGLPLEVILVRIELAGPGQLLVEAEANVTTGTSGGAFLVFNLITTRFQAPGHMPFQCSPRTGC